MKKLLVLTFAMLFLGVGIAGASAVKMSGEYYVRGVWSDNHNGSNIVDENDSHGIYDHEMSLNINWIMTPYTKVIARLELRDESWAVATNPTEEDRNGQQDDNIAVERLWAQHTFMNHTTIKVGLVQTSSWASDFSNDSTEAYRLMVVQPTKIGTFLAFTEKAQTYDALIMDGAVNTTVTNESGEVDKDNDTYVAALITKVGGVNVLPLIKYVDSEANDLQVIALDLGVNGTVNNIGFEAEVVYVDYNYEGAAATADYEIWGAYANVWAQLNALKVGGYIAHGSYDDTVDKGFTFGDDFANANGSGDSVLANRCMLLGDEVLMYGTYTNGALSNTDGQGDGELGHNDLNAVTLLALYATYAINEKASIAVLAAYADSNVDMVTNKYDGATAWEVNVGVEYKITPLLTYSAAAATAQKEYGDGSIDPDAAVELMHKLAFTF